MAKKRPKAKNQQASNNGTPKKQNRKQQLRCKAAQENKIRQRVKKSLKKQAEITGISADVSPEKLEAMVSARLLQSRSEQIGNALKEYLGDQLQRDREALREMAPSDPEGLAVKGKGNNKAKQKRHIQISPYQAVDGGHGNRPPKRHKSVERVSQTASKGPLIFPFEFHKLLRPLPPPWVSGTGSWRCDHDRVFMGIDMELQEFAQYWKPTATETQAQKRLVYTMIHAIEVAFQSDESLHNVYNIKPCPSNEIGDIFSGLIKIRLKMKDIRDNRFWAKFDNHKLNLMRYTLDIIQNHLPQIDFVDCEKTVCKPPKKIDVETVFGVQIRITLKETSYMPKFLQGPENPLSSKALSLVNIIRGIAGNISGETLPIQCKLVRGWWLDEGLHRFLDDNSMLQYQSLYDIILRFFDTRRYNEPGELSGFQKPAPPCGHQECCCHRSTELMKIFSGLSLGQLERYFLASVRRPSLLAMILQPEVIERQRQAYLTRCCLILDYFKHCKVVIKPQPLEKLPQRPALEVEGNSTILSTEHSQSTIQVGKAESSEMTSLNPADNGSHIDKDNKGTDQDKTGKNSNDTPSKDELNVSEIAEKVDESFNAPATRADPHQSEKITSEPTTEVNNGDEMVNNDFEDKIKDATISGGKSGSGRKNLHTTASASGQDDASSFKDQHEMDIVESTVNSCEDSNLNKTNILTDQTKPREKSYNDQTNTQPEIEQKHAPADLSKIPLQVHDHIDKEPPPWAPVLEDQVWWPSTLHQELLEFAGYIQLNKQEFEARNRVLRSLEVVVKSIWEKASIKPFGSYATSMATPQSDLDVYIQGVYPEKEADGDESTADGDKSDLAQSEKTDICSTAEKTGQESTATINSSVKDPGNQEKDPAKPLFILEDSDNSGAEDVVGEGFDATNIEVAIDLHTISSPETQAPNASNGNTPTKKRKWKQGHPSQHKDALHALGKLRKVLAKLSWIESIEYITHAKVPLLNIVTVDRIELDISLQESGDDCTHVIKKIEEEHYQYFKPLVMFLKTVLFQKHLDKPFHGGLGSFRLYMLIGYYLSLIRTQELDDLGIILLGFLRHFSKASNLNRDTVIHFMGLEVNFQPIKLLPQIQHCFNLMIRAITRKSFAKYLGLNLPRPSTISLILWVKVLTNQRQKCLEFCSAYEAFMSHLQNVLPSKGKQSLLLDKELMKRQTKIEKDMIDCLNKVHQRSLVDSSIPLALFHQVNPVMCLKLQVHCTVHQCKGTKV